MHIYFSGIGGVGLGPLAEIARNAGHDISGSDLSATPTLLELQQNGFEASLDQSGQHIKKVHRNKPIDWFVYTAALPIDHPELILAKKFSIKCTKRDELLKAIIEKSGQKLVAIAGTHGKTTTTAMVVWLFRELAVPDTVSYSIGATLSWGPSGFFDKKNKYFIYECDEFDRNFLHFYPDYSLVTNIRYDHADTYPSVTAYQKAFGDFMRQSAYVTVYQEELGDSTSLGLGNRLHGIDKKSVALSIESIGLAGRHNRENGYLAATLFETLTGISMEKIYSALVRFPGTSRRFEKLGDNLYSDYAHHPEEIAATLELASELSDDVIAVYQPHQNIRQHHLNHSNCFDLAEKIYWLPTYLSREDPSLLVLSSQKLTQNLDASKVVLSRLDEDLAVTIKKACASGKLVLLMGAGSIDDWARLNLV